MGCRVVPAGLGPRPAGLTPPPTALAPLCGSSGFNLSLPFIRKKFLLSRSPSVWKTQGRPWPTPTVDDRTGLGRVDVIIPGGEGVRGAPGEQGETFLEASVGCGAQKGTRQTRGLPAEQIAYENGRAVRWGDAGRLRPGVAPEASTPPESGGQQMLGGICFRRNLRKGPRHPRGLGSLHGQDQTEQRTQPSSGSRHQ